MQINWWHLELFSMLEFCSKYYGSFHSYIVKQDEVLSSSYLIMSLSMLQENIPVRERDKECELYEYKIDPNRHKDRHQTS